MTSQSSRSSIAATVNHTELLTMYKPNFCAECGERITRSRWHLWTSRRFCAECVKGVSKRRILLPLIACSALFGLGLLTGFSARKAPPPLVIERGQKSALSATAQNSSPVAPKPAPVYGPDGTATERPTDPNEIISICGARTKKGTPCSRRVRGTGRCWQHIGRPAILPPAKLIVQG